MIIERIKESEVVLKASDFAHVAHAGQTRKPVSDGPYYEHCKRTSLKLKNENDDVRAAAYLHDVVEDTQHTTGDLIDEGFPYYTVFLVDILTQRDNEEYGDYIERVLTNIDAIKIKRADTEDNLSDLPMYMKDKRAKYTLLLSILNNVLMEDDNADLKF